MEYHGLKIVVDSHVPEGEIHAQDRSGLVWGPVHKLVNIGTNPTEALIAIAYADLLSNPAPKKSIMNVLFGPSVND